MSAVTGKTRESKDYVKKTGFFEAEVIAFNPSKEKIEKMLGVELEEAPEYVSQEEGVTKSQIVVWLREVGTEEPVYRNVRFFLKDVDKKNKLSDEEREKGTKVEKKQYINDIGVTTWADCEENIPEWFKERKYRVAKDGEETLYNFIAAWLNKLDRRDKETVLSFDIKKLLAGNVKELNDEIGGQYAGTLAPLVTIRKVKKEGEEDKEYEQIYNREFLPGFVMKQIRLKKVDCAFIDKAKATERKKRSALQKFVLKVTDTQYGILDDIYTLGELEVYDPTKRAANLGKVLVDGDTEY